MVIANEEENLRELLPLVKPYVDEIIIVNQDSTDNTLSVCSEFGAKVFNKTRKFLADIDRNFCYQMATGDWIFALDADERPSIKLLENLRKQTENPDVDCYWFAFDNKVDGIDISDILGQEYHPRLWRKNYLQWSDRAHTWPQMPNIKQAFISAPVQHYRTLQRIEQVHALRKQAIAPQNQMLEERFLNSVRQKIKAVKGENGIQSNGQK